MFESIMHVGVEKTKQSRYVIDLYHIEAKNHFRIVESSATIFKQLLTALGKRFIMLRAFESYRKRIVL